MILQVQIDGVSDYYMVPKFFQYFIMTYRNSIGDISVPGYDEWYNNTDGEVSRMGIVLIVWLIWFLN